VGVKIQATSALTVSTDAIRGRNSRFSSALFEAFAWPFVLSVVVTDVSEMTTVEHFHVRPEFGQQHTVCGEEIFVGEALESIHVELSITAAFE